MGLLKIISLFTAFFIQFLNLLLQQFIFLLQVRHLESLMILYKCAEKITYFSFYDNSLPF